jgi:hypothetical protein
VNTARCVVDDAVYAASEFSRLPSAELERLRRQLVCVACGSRAFFRGRARGGRVACFGSNDHHVGCRKAAAHASFRSEGEASDLSGMDAIKVQLAAERSTEASAVSMGERGGTSDSAEAAAAARRSLRTVLRHVLTEPAFLYSDTVIEASDFPVLAARDFLVRFEQIIAHHVDQNRGFWGTVISYGMTAGGRSAGSASDAGGGVDLAAFRRATGWHPGRDLWLNAGPPSEPSVLIESRLVPELVRIHRLATLEDLVGCPVLVLGRCVRSSRGKVYIKPPTAAHLAFLDEEAPT